MSQGGSVGRYNYITGERWGIQPRKMELGDKNDLRFNWNTAIAQDPFEKNTIYFGGQFVFKSTNKGVSWETISPDLTTNDSSKIDQNNNGGLTIDITGAENYCTIICIAPSQKEKDVIWAGTDDGNVQLTRDGGKTWTNFRGKIPGMPVGCWIPQIRTSQYNAGEAFVVCNDYRRGDFKPYIFRTTDYGKTWVRMIDEKKVTGYALCMIQDPVEPKLIFVGTEQGLWISLDDGVSFEQWKNGYPSVSTYDFAIQEREADLAIASFGRAIWILDDIRPLRKLAANSGKPFTNNVMAFPSPDAYEAQYRPANGYDWSVYGLWDAANRPRGAAISFYINKLPKKDTAHSANSNSTPPVGQPTAMQQGGGGRGGRGQFGGGGRISGDSVLVRIYNDKNELIRTLRWGIDSGFNRQYWGMEEKGYRQPGSPKPRPGSTEPGGLQVLPGTYKVVISLAREMDSTFVTIKDDPRLGNRNDIKIAQRKMYDRLRKSTDKLTSGMDHLTDAEDVCNKITAEIKDLEGKEIDSLRKSSKIMLDSIKAIRELISGKQSERQGLNRERGETVMGVIQTANYSIGAKEVAPGAQEEKLVQNAELMISIAVQRINTFFENQWKTYRQQAEGTKINLFKDYKPIE